jgi:ABC-type branched-subunit amino acid transport system substrate-binding protein
VDDENVDMMLGIPNSAIALALVKVAEEKNRIVMPTAAATSALTGKSCGPNSIHFIYDTYGQTKTIVNALGQAGRRQLVLLTVDYAFGPRRRADATQFIKAAGRQGAGLGAAIRSTPGLLLLRAAGRFVEGQGPDGRQWRRRHHQRPSSRRPSSA